MSNQLLPPLCSGYQKAVHRGHPCQHRGRPGHGPAAHHLPPTGELAVGSRGCWESRDRRLGGPLTSASYLPRTQGAAHDGAVPASACRPWFSPSASSSSEAVRDSCTRLGVALVSKARPRSSVLHAELGAWSARALQRRAAEAEGRQAGRRVRFPK